MTDAKVPTPVPTLRRKPAARATRAVANVRDTAGKAVDATSSVAHDLAGKTAAGIEANPLAVLAGGVALGVVAGAFVPRSAREVNLLSPVGKRLSDTARGAIDAAKDSAKSELDVLGLSRNAARDQIGKLLGDVIKALTVAGTAALTAAKAGSPTPASAPTPKKPAKKAKPQA